MSWGLSCNTVTWIPRSQRSLSERFFHFLNWWNFLYQRRPQCDPKKPFSGSSKTVLMDCSTKHKRTLRNEYTHHQEVPRKASFKISSEDISFVTVSFIALRSIPLQISRKMCYQTDHWRETCNSVSCIHTWQCSFSEGFFPVLIWGYFPVTIALNELPNITLLSKWKQC